VFCGTFTFTLNINRIADFDIETFPTLYLYRFYCIIAGCGEVSEWFMVPLSKSGLAVSASAGSNPALSAR
jgi:hypothetical protein